MTAPRSRAEFYGRLAAADTANRARDLAKTVSLQKVAHRTYAVYLADSLIGMVGWSEQFGRWGVSSSFGEIYAQRVHKKRHGAIRYLVRRLIEKGKIDGIGRPVLGGTP